MHKKYQILVWSRLMMWIKIKHNNGIIATFKQNINMHNKKYLYAYNLLSKVISTCSYEWMRQNSNDIIVFFGFFILIWKSIILLLLWEYIFELYKVVRAYGHIYYILIDFKKGTWKIVQCASGLFAV